MTTAAIYVRVSSAGQEDGYSLDTQEEAGRQYAAKLGYTVDSRHVYRETHTGQDLYERPALTALRAAVADGQVDVVIVYAVDRLSRKQAHVSIIMDGIERAGGRIEFVAETFEDTAIGRFILAAKSFKAELELEDLRERSGRGRHRSGSPLLPPLGRVARLGRAAVEGG